MMKARTFFATAALVALTLLSAGCKKHSWSAAIGTPVQFRVESDAAASKAQTKTAYSGNNIAVGEHTYDRLDWISGDKIAIFMAYGEDVEATYSVLDYRVGSPTADGRKSKAPVSAVDQAHTWQGDGNHFFAAMYPSPSVKQQSATWQNVVELNRPILTYPATQILTPKGTTGADALTLLPDMDYAYMFALKPFNTVEDGAVTLTFVPVFTAFEVEISAGENESLDLTGFKLVSHNDEEPLACVKNIYTDELSNGSQEVSVDLTGTTLEQNGAPLILTVFVTGGYVGAVNFSSLTLEFTGNQIGTRTLDLKQNGEWITFAGNVKHRLSGLYFPKLDDATAGGQGINWGGMSGEDLGWNGAEGEDINWGGNRPLALPGEFSISATQKVNFSRGNLIYKGGEWDFHKMQYDRCFKDNGFVEIGPDATFDLFCWGTAGIAAADATMKYYQPWDYNDQVIAGQEGTNPYGFGPSITNVPNHTSWTAYSAYCDWGNNYKLKEKLGSGWFTMTAYEWEYIFQDRNASTVNGVENARYSKATVYGLPVLLIFPDSFGDDFRAAGGDDTVFTSSNINNDSKTEADYSYTVLSQAVWAMAEAAGAVIIAPTGCLQLVEGVHFFGIKDDEGICRINAVWSSTADDEDSVSFMGCIGPELSITEDGYWERNIGIAVRLVKLAE